MLNKKKLAKKIHNNYQFEKLQINIYQKNKYKSTNKSLYKLGIKFK